MHKFSLVFLFALFTDTYANIIRWRDIRDLYNLLNTTHRIWIIAASKGQMYSNSEAECVNYRTRNLTSTNVTLLYQVLTNSRNARNWRHNVTVNAQLVNDTQPTMKMNDWNDKNVTKRLLEWNPRHGCGIFNVSLLSGTKEKPWCEIHVQGPYLKAAYTRNQYSHHDGCERKFYDLCGPDAIQTTLFNRKCRNAAFLHKSLQNSKRSR
uniref:Lipocalin n=1 Tax=Rhipicephalus zambeziensis TaxID=60191 RepID=A0A224YN83_9ACAR